MNNKFRLSIQYIMENRFVIDYFTMALEFNALDIAFFLFFQYEDAIFLEFGKVMNSLVTCFQKSSKLLKAKLHMTKSLLPIFTFNGAKSFLEVISIKINDHSCENNLFSHSSNPLLCMFLLREFLILLTQKFFSLKNTCRHLNDRILKMAIEYIECCEDDNLLTTLMSEQDYTNRDCL